MTGRNKSHIIVEILRNETQEKTFRDVCGGNNNEYAQIITKVIEVEGNVAELKQHVLCELGVDKDRGNGPDMAPVMLSRVQPMTGIRWQWPTRSVQASSIERLTANASKT